MKSRVTIGECGFLGALVAVYAFFLSTYFVPVADNVDANGYIVAARIFQEHGRFSQVPPDDYTFVGRMWVANSRGEYYPKYPPLYPALTGLVMMGLGVDAGFHVVPACALLAVLGMYVLCRTQFRALLSLLGALALAVNPIFNIFALRQRSHAPSMCFLIWAYALFFLALRKETGRLRLASVFIAGLLLGYAVGIRYTNILLAIPPFFLVLSEMRGQRSRVFGAYVAGLAIPCVLLVCYHWTSFGGLLRTGYALTGEQMGFGWSYLASNTLRYATSAVTDLVGPLLIFSSVGLAVIWLKNRTRAIFFLIWVLPLVLLYVSYYWQPDLFPGAFLRFLLPVVVPAILLSLISLKEVVRRTGNRRSIEVLIILVFAGSLGWWGIRRTLFVVEKDYAEHIAIRSKVDFIASVVPEKSAVFGHPVLLLALDANQTYRLYPHVILDKNRIRESIVNTDKPLPPAMQEERAELLLENLSDVDNPTYISRVRSLLEAALSEGRGVFVVGAASVIERSVWSLPSDFAVEPVAEEKWIFPAYKVFSPDELVPPDEKGGARSREISSKIVRITRVTTPG
jgi:hypothetical protein